MLFSCCSSAGERPSTMSLCNVHRTWGPTGRLSGRSGRCALGSMARQRRFVWLCVGQLAPNQPAVSVQPLLHGGARRRHDRNRVAKDSAGRKLEPLVEFWRIAEADDIWKALPVELPTLPLVRLIISFARSRASTFAGTRLGTRFSSGLRHQSQNVPLGVSVPDGCGSASIGLTGARPTSAPSV